MFQCFKIISFKIDSKFRIRNSKLFYLSRQKPELNQQHSRHNNPAIPPDQQTKALQEQKRAYCHCNQSPLPETHSNIFLHRSILRKSPAQPKQKKRGYSCDSEIQTHIKQHLPQQTIPRRVDILHNQQRRHKRRQSTEPHPPKIGPDSHLPC